jgi:formylglycine-generating enzyme
MRNCISVFSVVVLTGLIIWSCSEENTSEPQNEAPTCEITSPADSSVFNRGDSIKVTVSADDTDSEIFEVRFYLDDFAVASDRELPYEYIFLADTLANGTHKIKTIAKAEDGSETEKFINIGIAPVTPANLKIELWTNYPNITLSWDFTDTDIDGFMIDRKVGESGSWVNNYANVSKNTISWIDTGLAPGTVYYYRIRSYYSTYYSDYTEVATTIPEDILERFVLIPSGSFEMGSTTGQTNEQPIHTVNLTKPFYLGRFEVTQKEWALYMPAVSYDHGAGDDYPAYYISWYSTLKYCNLRSIAEGLTPCYTINGSTDPSNWGSVPTTSLNANWDAAVCDWNVNGYRLPTEAEWEYAARYNDGRTYPWGNTTPNISLCNYDNDYNYETGSASIVGSYPNGNSQLGLCDMAGNVGEWVWDLVGSYPSSTQTDPTGASTNTEGRVIRPGCWDTEIFPYIRSAGRLSYRYLYANYSFAGFRVARTK